MRKKLVIKDGGWKEPVMDHPMLVVMKKIGINSLSDELLGSKNEPFKGGGTCRPHFGLSTSLTYPKV